MPFLEHACSFIVSLGLVSPGLVSRSLLPGMRGSLTPDELSERKMELVINHQQVSGLESATFLKTTSRVTAAVHIGLGCGQRQLLVLRDQRVALGIRESDPPAASQLLDQPICSSAIKENCRPAWRWSTSCC